jgi:hypothetical protein
MAIARGRRVKNLGWLLRNWKSVERFVIKAPDRKGADIGLGEARLVARLHDGETYETSFASSEVLFNWLNRPVFKGASVQWLGEHAEIGRGEAWKRIREKLSKRNLRQGEKWKGRWEGLPTFKTGNHGYEVRHDLERDRWYVLRDGSQQTNEVFASRESAHRWIKAAENELKAKVYDAKLKAAEAEQLFNKALHAREWKVAYDRLEDMNRAASHMQVYGDKSQHDAKRWDGIYKGHYKHLAEKAREHGYMTLGEWRASGFSGASAARHESGANPRVHSKRRPSSAARGNVLVDTSLKKRMNAVLGRGRK